MQVLLSANRNGVRLAWNLRVSLGEGDDAGTGSLASLHSKNTRISNYVDVSNSLLT